jgi:hypothetical protein
MLANSTPQCVTKSETRHILLPEPLAALVRELIASRHGHATLGDQGTSRWLFPGGRPGRPISAEHLG